MQFYNYPAPLCIINNFLSEINYTRLRRELQSIKPHLKTHENRKETREITPFVEIINDKVLGNSELIKELSLKSWAFQYLSYENILPRTCVQLYEHGDTWEYHQDDSVLSIVYFIQDGEFEGGDFYINHVKIHIENNSLVIFPSCMHNSIKPVAGPGCLWAVHTCLNLKMDSGAPPDIHRFKNFLSPDEWRHTLEIIKDNRNWSHTERSNFDPLGSKLWNIDLGGCEFFTRHIFNKIPNGPWKLLRVYANGQLFGQDGGFHQDSPDQKDWTFMIYANNIDSNFLPKWGGETEFITNTGHMLIPPEPNSAVLFKSSIYHRGRGPSKFTNDLRVTIAWKLTKLDLDEDCQGVATSTL
jgi:hypothetical protein